MCIYKKKLPFTLYSMIFTLVSFFDKHFIPGPCYLIPLAREISDVMEGICDLNEENSTGVRGLDLQIHK